MGHAVQRFSFEVLPLSIALVPQDIHVWFVNLDRPLSEIQSLHPLLSPDEQERADRFHGDRHRFRFIAGRGMLRRILSCYLNRDPDQIQFAYSDRGKPMLASSHSPLAFNMSHSADHALYAITCDRLVGVDLEHRRPIDQITSLAKRFFTPQEYAQLVACDPPDQQDYFFRLWTCKEAYLKAIGEGLAGLAHVEVGLTADQTGAMLYLHGSSQPASEWTVMCCDPDPDYAAALAAPGANWQMVNYVIA